MYQLTNLMSIVNTTALEAMIMGFFPIMALLGLITMWMEIVSTIRSGRREERWQYIATAIVDINGIWYSPKEYWAIVEEELNWIFLQEMETEPTAMELWANLCPELDEWEQVNEEEEAELDELWERIYNADDIKEWDEIAEQDLSNPVDASFWKEEQAARMEIVDRHAF